MSTLLPVPMPHWAGGRLEYLWCTGCKWRFPIHADSPDRETELRAKAAYEAHDCKHHMGNRVVVLIQKSRSV